MWCGEFGRQWIGSTLPVLADLAMARLKEWACRMVLMGQSK